MLEEKISLYRGSGDFSSLFTWNDVLVSQWQVWLEAAFGSVEAFQRETGLSLSTWASITVEQCRSSKMGEFLLHLFYTQRTIEDLLALHKRIPIAASTVVEIEMTEAIDSIIQSYLHASLHEKDIVVHLWGDHALPITWDAEGAVLLPLRGKMALYHSLSSLRQQLHQLQAEAIPFRVIFEEEFHLRWDQLEWVVYNPSTLSSEGKRKLAGFEAAGGTIRHF